MYQNQLFFDDFQKVFKVKIVEKKVVLTKVKQNTSHTHSDMSFWLKRLMVKLHVQYMFH